VLRQEREHTARRDQVPGHLARIQQFPVHPRLALYLAAFESDHECLRLLLPYAPDIAATTALSAPISTGDAAGVRLLLDAGADLNHLLDAGLLGESHEQEPPVPPLSAAVDLESGSEMVGLLLERGADPDVPGWHGRTPYQQAVRTGQGQLADLLARHGASTAMTAIDEFLAACRRADRAAATAVLAASPDLAGRLTVEDHRVLTDAAGHGHTEAVRLILDLGFPPGTRSEPDNGATALHLAAAAGSTGTVRLLLVRGADIEARDTAWNSTPLEWAIVGSGMRLGHDPDPDWPVTVGTLLDAGASADGIVLSSDDPSRPAPRSPPCCAPAGSPTRLTARRAAKPSGRILRFARVVPRSHPRGKPFRACIAPGLRCRRGEAETPGLRA
jgi:ankyrin repeat protein